MVAEATLSDLPQAKGVCSGRIRTGARNFDQKQFRTSVITANDEAGATAGVVQTAVDDDCVFIPQF